MAIDIATAKSELTKHFPGLKSAFTEDFAKIAVYLGQPPPFAGMKGKWQEVLTKLTKQEMDVLEWNHGFEKEIVPITGLIQSAQDFFNIFIKEGNVYAFNDTGAPADTHGPYTHRVQWCVLMKALDLGKLNVENTIKDIYTELGKPECFGDKFAVWDYLVDANREVPQPSNGYAARSPENIWGESGYLKDCNATLYVGMK